MCRNILGRVFSSFTQKPANLVGSTRPRARAAKGQYGWLDSKSHIPRRHLTNSNPARPQKAISPSEPSKVPHESEVGELALPKERLRLCQYHLHSQV